MFGRRAFLKFLGIAAPAAAGVVGTGATVSAAIPAPAAAKVGRLNPFEMPPGSVPDGWVYNWKRISVMGGGHDQEFAEHVRAGWKCVPRSRHIDLFPDGQGYWIEVSGLVLMEKRDAA